MKARPPQLAHHKLRIGEPQVTQTGRIGTYEVHSDLDGILVTVSIEPRDSPEERDLIAREYAHLFASLIEKIEKRVRHNAPSH